MPAIIGWAVGALLAGLARMFASRLGLWLLTAMAFIGIELAVTETANSALMDYVNGQLGGVPDVVTSWAGYLQFDKYLSLVVSALVVSSTSKVFLRKRRG